MSFVFANEPPKAGDLISTTYLRGGPKYYYLVLLVTSKVKFDHDHMPYYGLRLLNLRRQRIENHHRWYARPSIEWTLET